MMAQLRPDIASATEQTVLNLKEVESRLASLKNDLAWLCQGIGHPEAARVAAAPTGAFAGSYAPTGLALGAWSSLPGNPGIPTNNPAAGQGFNHPTIYGNPPQATAVPFGAAFGQAPWTPTGSPFPAPSGYVPSYVQALAAQAVLQALQAASPAAPYGGMTPIQVGALR